MTDKAEIAIDIAEQISDIYENERYIFLRQAKFYYPNS